MGSISHGIRGLSETGVLTHVHRGVIGWIGSFRSASRPFERNPPHTRSDHDDQAKLRLALETSALSLARPNNDCPTLPLIWFRFGGLIVTRRNFATALTTSLFLAGLSCCGGDTGPVQQSEEAKKADFDGQKAMQDFMKSKGASKEKPK